MSARSTGERVQLELRVYVNRFRFRCGALEIGSSMGSHPSFGPLLFQRGRRVILRPSRACISSSG